MWLGKPCWCSSNCRCATPGFRIDSYLWGGWKQEPPSFDKSIELFPVASPMKHHATERRDAWWFLLYHPMVDFLLYSSWLTWTPEIKFADLAWSNGIQRTPDEFQTHFFEFVTYQNLAITKRWFSPSVLKMFSNLRKILQKSGTPTKPSPFSNIETGTPFM